MCVCDGDIKKGRGYLRFAFIAPLSPSLSFYCAAILASGRKEGKDSAVARLRPPFGIGRYGQA